MSGYACDGSVGKRGRVNMASSSSTYSLPQLTADNFTNWKFRVTVLLEEKGVDSVINAEPKLEGLDEKSLGQFKVKDAKARNTILMCVSDKHIEYVKSCSTAFSMIKNLESIFERKSILSKLFIRKKLLQLKYQDGQDLQEHFSSFDSLIRDLESTGSKLEEEDKVCHLLLTMSRAYDTVITVLETSSAQLSVEFVKSKLLDYELKMKNEVVNTERNNKEDCAFKSNAWHRKCYNCGSTNHLKADCNKPPRKYNNTSTTSQNKKKNFNKAYTTTTDKTFKDNAEISFLALSCETKSEQTINFVLDSGATNNLVTRSVRPYMHSVKQIPEVSITIANGSTISAHECGTLSVKCHSGLNVNISAIIVDGLSHNLLSVPKVTSGGHKVVFTDSSAKILCKEYSITFNMVNKLYSCRFIVVNAEEEKCNISQNEENIWHLRLGHLNRKGLQTLGLNSSREICDSCKKGKSARLPFNRVIRLQSKRIGELLHCDLWGPAPVEGLNGERYYLSILDDFSHFSTIYLLCKKSEAEDHLIGHILKMNSDNKKVSRIRSDCGGEFSSNKFKKFCLDQGISQEFTAGYSPQQNGKAERLNRTIMDKVRSMFIDTDLPKYLWGEAVYCAAYQLNRSPSRAINNQVPVDRYYGRRDLSKLRIFGSKVWYIKIPRSNKLEPRSIEARMVGYSPSGYRLWNPTLNKIIISRDCHFDEGNIKFMDEKKGVDNENKIDGKENEEEEHFMEDKPEGDIEKQESQPTTKDQEQNLDDTNSDVRPKRSGKPPPYLQDYEVYQAFCLLTNQVGPQTYNEAIEDPEWEAAIKKELLSLENLEAWEEVTPTGKEDTVDTKWVFCVKSDGCKKARLVAKGFQQDLDCELYAPVARLSTIRSLISYSLNHNYNVVQLDIPSAFINGKLHNDTYILPPKGYTHSKNCILKLRKALYGLKNASRNWYDTMHSFLVKLNFERSLHDFCLYVKEEIMLVIFVDDILATGPEAHIDEICIELKNEFSAKHLGYLKNYLGLEIKRTGDTVEINQTKMIGTILSKFNMVDCKGVKTPISNQLDISVSQDHVNNVPYREIIGSLMYISLGSRPDITYAVSYLSQFLDKPTIEAWKAAKHVLRYLRETKHLNLCYYKNDCKIEAYSDADWASDKIDRKSVSGGLIMYRGNPVQWFSRKQNSVAQSSTEAEYISAALTTSELISILGIVSTMENKVMKGKLFVDNQGSIQLTKNYENSKRSKHIDIKYHFIKDIVNKGIIDIEYVPTIDNISDILTKPLNFGKFNCLRAMLNLR